MEKWEKISEEILSENGYWTYKHDKFKVNGKNGDYYYVHTSGSTMVVPLLPNNKILMIKQYRYLSEQFSIEFPCGVIEKDLSPEDNARKELREETGFDSSNLKLIAKFNPYNGVTDEICYVYVATGLFPSPLQPDFTEEFELVELDAKEIDKLIKSNELWDGMSVAAWQYYKLSCER